MTPNRTVLAPPAPRRSEWSLVRRWTTLVTVCMACVLLAQAGLVLWFVRDVLDREVEALFLEEVAELRFNAAAELLDADRLRRIGADLDRSHPDVAIGLRAWAPPFEKPWGVAGTVHREHWPKEPAEPERVEAVREFGHRISAVVIDTPWRTDDGREGLGPVHVDLMIDATERWRQLRQSGVLLIGVALVGGLGAVGAGLVLARGLRRMLTNVEASARAAHLDDDSELSPPPRAPREISGVVRALGGSIEQMRKEHARNVLLTAGLAHELRSPLQNLISTAEVTLLKNRDATEYAEVLQRQLGELEDLALVVDNLITLTALRDRTTLARGSSFDLEQEVRLRLSREEQEAQRRGVDLVVNGRGDCRLTGDREALVLMVRNLVLNALKWTPRGTEVVVDVEGNESAVVVAVTDAGPGVPESERSQIFEPFYQGPKPRDMRASYGLGLALARAAVRGAGGQIRIEDARGGGARFVATLPRTDGPEPVRV